MSRVLGVVGGASDPRGPGMGQHAEDNTKEAIALMRRAVELEATIAQGTVEPSLMS